MNDRHCEQSDTLFFAPYIPSKLVVRKQKTDLQKPVLSKNTISILLILLFHFGYSSLLYYLLDGLLIKDRILSSMIIGIFPAVFSVMGITSEKFTNFIEITKPKKTAIHILEKGLQINDDFSLWTDIKKINYKRMTKNKTAIHSPNLKIYFKNGTTREEKFGSKNPGHQKSFLLALAWTSEHTEVEIQTDNQNEYTLLASVVNNYENMKLEKPYYLL